MRAFQIADLRRQHDAAEQMASEIAAGIAAYCDARDAPALAAQLASLNALLRIHFAYEDTTLYPAMVTGADRQAALLAHAFQAEMGTLAMRFADFVKRWSSPAGIASAFPEFREHALAMLAALATRIERENDQLYPLAVEAHSAAA